MNRYKTILPMIAAMIAMITMLLIGCTAELSTDELPTQHSGVVLSVTTRTGEEPNGSANESTVGTLRLMIFNTAGTLIKNAYYGEAALQGMKTAQGAFTITARLPRDLGELKVCLIANEPDSWGLGRTANPLSYTALKKLAIHYSRDFDFIGNNGNRGDLNLYIPPTDKFLMTAETTLHFAAGDTTVAEVLPLCRTAAKVTLTMAYDRLHDVDYDNGESFVLKSVFIQNQPIYSHLSPQGYSNDEYFPTAGIALTYNPDKKATRPVTFYIPEHYLSAEAFGSQMNTFIELQGEYTTAVGVRIPVIYRIPLGEGAQKIVSNGSYPPAIEDYAVVRNHHYAVSGRITKLGEKEGIQAKISILPWKNGGEIDVDTRAPYLNVSEIALERTLPAATPDVSDRIFLWSNQPKEQIVLGHVITTFYDAGGLETDVFALPAQYHPLIGVELTKYAADAGSNFVENNGHITVNVHLPPSIGWTRLVVTFYLKAGNLKRQVSITYTSP